MEDLPAHIMTDILSKLPVKTIVYCKCVCKKWRNLVLDPHFVKLHPSRSPTGLVVHHNLEQHMSNGHTPGILKLVEIQDEPDHHRLHHDPIMTLDLNLGPLFQKTQILPVGSVNGLICLWQFNPGNDNTYICNPITREHMILPRQQYYRQGYAIIVYGFGASSVTGEYKVIQTFRGGIPPNPYVSSRPNLLEANVYTLGTSQWRGLGHVPHWLNGFHGPFLNSRAQWIVLDQDSPENLCAFDFDKETFQLFPSPPEATEGRTELHFHSLGVLKGCLCKSESYDFEFTIWVMKEYGIKKSWCKEVMIKQSISPDLDCVTCNLCIS